MLSPKLERQLDIEHHHIRQKAVAERGHLKLC